MTIFKAHVDTPEAFADQWRPYERMLRERYCGNGVPPKEVATMLDRLRPIFLRHAFLADQHHSTDAGDAFERVQNWVAQVTFGLLCEVAAREAKLIELAAT
jgi:hypothetical protein